MGAVLADIQEAKEVAPEDSAHGINILCCKLQDPAPMSEMDVAMTRMNEE